MNKKLTGLRFTPQQFRLLNQCVECGKATTIRRDEKCDECVFNNLSHCEICEIVLRKGEYKFYTYDIKEEHREGGIEFKANKECVREFTYQHESICPQATETLCECCINWEKQMKNECGVCKKGFQNSKEHYKFDGNICDDCAFPEEVEGLYPNNNQEKISL